jgi:hypothetical protein
MIDTATASAVAFLLALIERDAILSRKEKRR